MDAIAADQLLDEAKCYLCLGVTITEALVLALQVRILTQGK